MNSATRRNVMLLDTRPGEPGREYREVRGVRIESGVAIPKTHPKLGKLKEIMLAMNVGDSFFTVKRSKLDGKAKLPGREYASRRVDGGYRTWRTK